MASSVSSMERLSGMVTRIVTEFSCRSMMVADIAGVPRLFAELPCNVAKGIKYINKRSYSSRWHSEDNHSGKS